MPMRPISYMGGQGSPVAAPAHLRARVPIMIYQTAFVNDNLDETTPPVPIMGTNHLVCKAYAYTIGGTGAAVENILDSMVVSFQKSTYLERYRSDKGYWIYDSSEVWSSVGVTPVEADYRATSTRTSLSYADPIFFTFESDNTALSDLKLESGFGGNMRWIRARVVTSSSVPSVKVGINIEFWSNLWVTRNRQNPYSSASFSNLPGYWNRFDLSNSDIRNAFYTKKEQGYG